MEENEVWTPVLNYTGLYSVSSLGRIRKETTAHKRGAIKKPTFNQGYYSVSLYKNLLCKCFRLHRLVWAAFNGPIPEKMVINHIDGNGLNNVLSNLECVTAQENIIHAYRQLKRQPSNTKINEATAKQIRELRAEGSGVRELAARFQLTYEHIRNIVNGRVWLSAGGPITPSRKNRFGPARDREKAFSAETVADVIRRYAAGESAQALAEETGAAIPTVLNWCRGKTRRLPPALILCPHCQQPMPTASLLDACTPLAVDDLAAPHTN